MKLLLTDSGITNNSIRQALIYLLGKPLAESSLVFVPTAMYALPGGTGYVGEILKGLIEDGWKSVSVLELTALPSTLEEYWLPTLEAADAIMVSGGGTAYLSYWMYKSGLADKLPPLLDKLVYIGFSAGSQIVSHSVQFDADTLAEKGYYYDAVYDEAAPPNAGSDKTLKLVDFVYRPHVGSDYFPNITFENMERDAAALGVPMYVTDDQTAIVVTDKGTRVVSEGVWKLFGGQG